MTLGSFRPDARAGTVTMAASTTSATVALPATSGEAVLVTNTSAALAFVAVGPVATVNDLPLPAGQKAVLGTGRFANAVAAILASGTGNVYFTRGSLSAN